MRSMRAFSLPVLHATAKPEIWWAQVWPVRAAWQRAAPLESVASLVWPGHRPAASGCRPAQRTAPVGSPSCAGRGSSARAVTPGAVTAAPAAGPAVSIRQREERRLAWRLRLLPGQAGRRRIVRVMAASVIIEGVRPVETGAGPVLSHDGPGVSVGGGFGQSAERYVGVQRCGHERAPQGVRAGALGYCCEGFGGAWVDGCAGHPGGRWERSCAVPDLSRLFSWRRK